MLRGGYLHVARVRGVALRIHFTALLASLVAVYYPTVWLSGLIVILLHEAGHAWFARRYRARVFSIDVHALGGHCRYGAHLTKVQTSVVAWGGVLAQVMLLALLEGLFFLRGIAPVWLLGFAATLTAVNMYIGCFNLLPIPPLDGWEAWKLFRYSNLSMWWRRGTLNLRAASIQHQLDQLGRASAPVSTKKPRTTKKEDSWLN